MGLGSGGPTANTRLTLCGLSAEGTCKDSWRKCAGSVQEVHDQCSGSAQTTFKRRADNGNGMRREKWNQGLAAGDWLRVKGSEGREIERLRER